MHWNDIPKFPHISYSVTIPWRYLESNLKDYIENHNLQMDPDFQRGHVWTEEQQISYVEFMLRKPTSGKDIYFNHPGWMKDWEGDFVLVDGKQRIEAVRSFLQNKLRIFGHLYSEFDSIIPPTTPFFTFHVARLATRADVLQWYIDFNAGGTPHSKEEIDRVREMLQKEV